RRASNGFSAACSSFATAAATFPNTFRSSAPYGRDAIVRSCARRSFAAETIFMALVICCVFFTERMRRRISIKLGMGFCRRVLRQESSLEFLDNAFYLRREVGVQRLLRPDLLQHAAMRVL